MKKCPYCVEQIQDDAIKCRYCGSMLSGSAEPSTIRAADGMHDRVRQLARSGQVIEAIKVVREQTGLGLKEAKDGPTHGAGRSLTETNITLRAVDPCCTARFHRLG